MLFGTRCVLLVAHPGHELLVQGWMHRVRPRVFVLTDGSGDARPPRIETSRRMIEECGATCGSIFGRFPDRELYAAIIDGKWQALTAIVEGFANELVRLGTTVVVTDAVEGYNPVHDLCQLIAGAAIALTGSSSIRQYDYPVVGGPHRYDAMPGDAVTHHDIPDSALEKKMLAARDYAAELSDVDVMLSRWPVEAFRRESFRRVDDWCVAAPADDPPQYERFGEQRVAAGSYARVIRFATHMAPLRDAICEWAETARCAS